MSSFRAPMRAYDALLAFLRTFQITGRTASWLLIACLAGTADLTQAQSLAALSNASSAEVPLAMVGMGLVSSGNFSIAISENEIGATSRLAGTALLTVTPTGGFSEPVGFECTGLPAGAACSFSPATVMPAGNPANDTITVSYSRPAAALKSDPSPLVPAGIVTCALLCCIGLRRHPLFLAAVVAAAAFGLCTGCGTGNSALKTYPVTVTAASGSLHHNVSFLLTVE